MAVIKNREREMLFKFQKKSRSAKECVSWKFARKGVLSSFELHTVCTNSGHHTVRSIQHVDIKIFIIFFVRFFVWLVILLCDDQAIPNEFTGHHRSGMIVMCDRNMRITHLIPASVSHAAKQPRRSRNEAPKKRRPQARSLCLLNTHTSVWLIHLALSLIYSYSGLLLGLLKLLGRLSLSSLLISWLCVLVSYGFRNATIERRKTSGIR